MNTKQYDYKSLVRAYLDTHRRYYVHDDFRSYYEALLAKLEQAFDIAFSKADAPLRMLFDSTVSSYWSITDPGASFLDGSLIFLTLEKLEELGQHVLSTWDEVAKCAEQSRTSHLQMLYALFVCMFGEVNTIVTSADLQSIGFDDATEPNIANYDDYL